MTSRVALSLVAFTGCALLSNSPSQSLRYFAPPTANPFLTSTLPLRTTIATNANPAEPIAPLRLGPVTSTNYLRYPIEHRASSVEVEPYQTLRWTELPEAYVQRSLASALFDAHRLEQASGATAPVLEVEVLAFEEIEHAGRRGGRVQLGYKVFDARHVLANGVITMERQATRPTIDAVVVAIGQAMAAASAELADRVAIVLRTATPVPL